MSTYSRLMVTRQLPRISDFVFGCFASIRLKSSDREAGTSNSSESLLVNEVAYLLAGILRELLTCTEAAAHCRSEDTVRGQKYPYRSVDPSHLQARQALAKDLYCIVCMSVTMRGTNCSWI